MEATLPPTAARHAAAVTGILFVMATEQEYGPQLRQRIRPLITGVGPVEAAVGTARHLGAGNRPDVVVSLGTAGSRRHPVGTVWQVSSVSWRDMDASRLGFPKGVTPFADHPVAIPLLAPLPDVPAATLSTGGTLLGPGDYDGLPAELADMETFAVVRACGRFGIPVVGLRGVSDGSGDPGGPGGWADRLALIDSRLAPLVDRLPAALARVGGGPPRGPG